MKIVHFSTRDTAGGAARAMFRLHAAMADTGHKSSLICRDRDSHRPDVYAARDLLPHPPDEAHLGLQRRLDALVDASRTPLTDTILTATAVGHNLAGSALVQSADVLQLHWVSQFLSPADIARLGTLGKPLAWRLSDLWPFTGGCHYAAGCQGFLTNCADCPQLVPALHALPRAQLAAKRRAVASAPLTIVSPSRWLAGLAQDSAAFRGKRVEVVINGVDRQRFHPEPGARRRLGLARDAAIVLFVATHTERRKGFHLLVRALEELRQSFGGARLPDGRRLMFCCLGQGVERLSGLGVPTVPFGFVDDDAQLRLIYSAADLFVIPSLEENLPSTALEAMACGLPVVGFQAGGVPDVVDQGHSGLLVPSGDVPALAGALRELLQNPQAARAMGRAGLARVEQELNVETQAARYLDLYRDLCQGLAGTGANRSAAQAEPAAPPAPEIPRELLELAQSAGPMPDAAADEDASRRREALAKAFALRDAGQAAQGRAALEELARRLPEDLELRQTLGGMLAAEGRTAEAVGCFRWCLTRQPWQYDFLLNASDAWRYAGRYDEALATLDEIEAASPHHRGLWLKRGQTLAAAGRVREGIKALLREVRTHRCPRAAGLLRELWPQRGRR